MSQITMSRGQTSTPNFHNITTDAPGICSLLERPPRTHTVVDLLPEPPNQQQQQPPHHRLCVDRNYSNLQRQRSISSDTSPPKCLISRCHVAKHPPPISTTRQAPYVEPDPGNPNVLDTHRLLHS